MRHVWMSGVIVALVAVMSGCGSEIEGDDDELCEEALSADEKVRCRDTTMVKASRAYRMPDGTLHIVLEGELLRDKPVFYVSTQLTQAAQERAPRTWNWTGDQGISTTFYDRERSPTARSPFYAFPPEQGTLTISEYNTSKVKGVLRNFRYEDKSQLRGVALVPTMRFDIACVGAPATDDASCATKCGTCVATDRCGNKVTVPLTPCP